MRRLLNNLDFHKESYRQITLFKQDRSGLVRTDPIRSGQIGTNWYRSGHESSRQVGTGQD